MDVGEDVRLRSDPPISYLRRSNKQIRLPTNSHGAPSEDVLLNLSGEH
jgi:hypothetical protein